MVASPTVHLALLLVLSSVLVSSAASRSTEAAIVSPKPNLPLSDVNIVIVTDVHSWVGGHGTVDVPTTVPGVNRTVAAANYGDVLSFVQRLKQYGEETGQDFWFVMNGDWIE